MQNPKKRKSFSKPLLVAVASGASAFFTVNCGGGGSYIGNPLHPPPGTLCIDSVDPAAAVVKVNGAPLTADSGTASAGRCTATYVSSLNVTATAPGYKDFSETVDFSQSQLTTIHKTIKMDPQ